MSDYTISELAKTAQETGDFTQLESIACEALQHAQQAWEPFEQADERWKKWNNLPGWKKMFHRQPDCHGGRDRCRAAEQVMWMEALHNAVQQRNVRGFIMQSNN